MIAALAAAALGASIGPAVAQADKPFALACEGRLDAKGGQYFFAEGDKPLNANSDDDLVCAHVTIAEKSTKSALRQSLKEDTISRLLRACRVGASCKVSGSVLNLSHDVFVFVRIDSISAK
jgi:hypothetical protein